MECLLSSLTADNYHDDTGLLFNRLGITDRNELRKYDILVGDLNANKALTYADNVATLSMETLCGICGCWGWRR